MISSMADVADISSEPEINFIREVNSTVLPYRLPENCYRAVAGGSMRGKIASLGGRRVGGLIMKEEGFNGEKYVYVYSIAVLGVYRGMGVGSSLIKSVFDHCAKCGIEYVRLHSVALDQDIYSFYKKNGFVVKEHIPNYYVCGSRKEDALFYERRITMKMLDTNHNR